MLILSRNTQSNATNLRYGLYIKPKAHHHINVIFNEAIDYMHRYRYLASFRLRSINVLDSLLAAYINNWQEKMVDVINSCLLTLQKQPTSTNS